MAKGSANETVMGNLHAQVARVFTKVLASYEGRLDALEKIDPEKVEADMLEALLGENSMPSPAMLSAITKFLKDNDIGFDTQEIATLSATDERLRARKAKRSNLVKLSNLSLVANE